MEEYAEEAGELVIPPLEEIEKLYHLAKFGNMQHIRTQADYLEALDPRYASLRQAVAQSGEQLSIQSHSHLGRAVSRSA